MVAGWQGGRLPGCLVAGNCPQPAPGLSSAHRLAWKSPVDLPVEIISVKEGLERRTGFVKPCHPVYLPMRNIMMDLGFIGKVEFGPDKPLLCSLYETRHLSNVASRCFDMLHVHELRVRVEKRARQRLRANKFPKSPKSNITTLL